MIDVIVLAKESLDFAKAIKMQPHYWKVGNLEAEQLMRQALLSPSFHHGFPPTHFLGIPIELTKAESQFDLVLQ